MISKMDKVIKWFVILSGGGAVLYLQLLSMFGTSYATTRIFGTVDGKPDMDGYNYCLADNIWVHFWVICGFILIVYLVGRFICPLVKADPKWISAVIGTVYFSAGAWLILSLQLHPNSDSAKILSIAEQMVNGQYDAFQAGEGYLWRYPDQLGIICFYYLITLLFGSRNFLVIQFVNLGAATAIGFLARKICSVMWKEAKWTGIGVQLLYSLFSPLFFYITYIYGTIPGVSLSLAAIYCELLFLRRKKLKYAIEAAIFIGLAVIMKTNSLVMMVAMIIFLVYDLIMENQRAKTAIALIFILVFPMIFTEGIHAFMGSKANSEISRGMPKLSWVAMALQESRMAPGTRNGYSVSLYEAAGYDYDKTNQLAINSIKDSLEHFESDKSEALRWLGRKMAFQWNDPFFGAAEMIRGRESEIGLSSFLDSMINGRLYYWLRIYLNYLQTIILTGTLLYFFSKESRQKREKLILLVVFLGGFLFHIVWEAKREYVLPYFLMLFPYAVRGYQIIAYRLRELFHGERYLNKRKIIYFLGGAVIGIFIWSTLYPTRLIQYTVAVRDEEELRIPVEEDIKKRTFVVKD